MEQVPSVPDETLASWFTALQQAISAHPLLCPQCRQPASLHSLLQGETHNFFVELHCPSCRELAFFQIETPTLADPDWPATTLTALQSEWEEWFAFKQRHLYQRPTPPARNSLYVVLAIVLLSGTLFFLLDQYYLLGAFEEDVAFHQQAIDRYVRKLATLPCFSAALKEKIATVPVFYTTDSVYHHEATQYGETGVDWGTAWIKIHRSNFWFFGWPKQTQLIHTLLHEFLHRLHPAWGHNAPFYDQLEQEVRCALQYW